MDRNEREKVILERILTLKQIVQESRGGPIELHELAVCYYHLENYKQAVEFASQLLTKYPTYVELAAVHSLRILCLVLSGDHSEALKLLDERLKVQPADTTLLGMTAFAQEKSGKMKESIETHRRILKIDPVNANSLNSLGYLLTLHGKPSESAEAFDCLKKAIELFPTHPAYLDSLGVFLTKKGQKDNARKALMKALRKSPQNGEILQHLKETLGLETKKEEKKETKKETKSAK